jgi:hypothetical protein
VGESRLLENSKCRVLRIVRIKVIRSSLPRCDVLTILLDKARAELDTFGKTAGPATSWIAAANVLPTLDSHYLWPFSKEDATQSVDW